ncbi:MAG: outer membrane lipoprotein carrier protein LolA [Bacteroidales bacterium]|nr:outer membrane lipoprotein carrier protein LolA [Bacteroidales bacterium]MBR4213827.1 outer membrane lipoprotein carrier protein LolA [Bacteroidales bacterium]
MKITKFLAAAMLITATSTALYAQDETHDPAAKKVLDKVLSTTKSYETLRASFNWAMENKAEKTRDTKKGFMFIKGDKYKLILQGTEIFTDGNTLWSYSKDINEITINEVEEDAESIVSNPTKIFELYKSGFKYRLKGEQSVTEKAIVNGKETDTKRTCYIIDLYPEKPATVEYHTIQLAVDKATTQIVSIDIMFKNGTDQIIVITEYKPNTPMPDSLFKFDASKYPGVEVNDMR